MELKNEPKIGLELRMQRIIVVVSISVVLLTIGFFTYLNLSSSPDSVAGTQSTENTITGKLFCDVDQDGVQDNFENDLDNVKVWLYEDTDGDGIIDPGESAIDSTTTNSSGAYSFTTNYTSGSGTLSFRIDSDNSDADEKSNGDVERDKNYVKLNNRLVAFRFNNVNIPQGTTISSASVKLNAYSNNSSSVSVDVYADDTDDSRYISEDEDDISDRTPTSGSVSWSIGSWSTDQDYSTPDISSVIQEVVNRSGWKSGNDLTIIMERSGSSTATKKVTAHDYSSSKAALLSVSYGSNSGTSNKYVVKVDTTSYSGSSSTTSSEIAVSFSSGGTTSGNNNFGLANACGGNGKNIIRGSLYNDANRNAKKDNGENNQSGVKIKLYKDTNGNNTLDNGDQLIDSTTTNGAGKYQFVVDYNQSSDSTITMYIGHDNNDAEEDTDDDDVSLSGNTLDLNKDIVGLRYTDIGIPQGATITSASLTFTAKESENGTCHVKIYGEDKDDASGFSYGDGNLSDRTRTSASKNWSVPNFSCGSSHETDDLSSIVQEIVDRSGWKSGNDMVFLIYPQSGGSGRDAKSHDNSASQCPKLSISFSTGNSNADNMYMVEIDTSDNVEEVTTSQTMSVTFTTSGNQTEETQSGIYDPGSLPVEFLYFHASQINDQAELVWATAMEENNSHFEIERSLDGFTFENIGEEAGNGNSYSVIEYKYIDAFVPNQETPIYYRLKQVDYNGDFDYSPVVFIQTGEEREAKVFPNPASNFINVSKNGYRFSASLIDQSGTTIAYKESETNFAQFDIKDLPNGFYVVQISSRTGTESKKILIKH